MAGSGVNEGFGMAAEKGSGNVPVAQSIRHPPTKREIAGSSPVGDFILSPTSSHVQTRHVTAKWETVKMVRLS